MKYVNLMRNRENFVSRSHHLISLSPSQLLEITTRSSKMFEVRSFFDFIGRTYDEITC